MPWPSIGSFLASDRSTLAGAILLAVIAAVIKFVADDRKERIARRVQRLQEQIEQFYGPLFSIVDQLDIAFHVERKILHDNELTDPEVQCVRRFMFVEIYRPLHLRIREIMLSRLYLVDGLAVPETFTKYLRHSAQYEVQARLWFEQGVSSERTRGTPYPPYFNADVQEGLEDVMDRLGVALREIRVVSETDQERPKRRADEVNLM